MHHSAQWSSKLVFEFAYIQPVEEGSRNPTALIGHEKLFKLVDFDDAFCASVAEKKIRHKSLKNVRSRVCYLDNMPGILFVSASSHYAAVISRTCHQLKAYRR